FARSRRRYSRAWNVSILRDRPRYFGTLVQRSTDGSMCVFLKCTVHDDTPSVLLLSIHNNRSSQSISD
ncbi:hypothetical protein PENTCL1PPCAC_13250, partial [Pristionchus entomophagus]